MLRKLEMLSVLLVFGMWGGASAELISYHPFNEAAGTTAADASGHGNDGTLSAGVEWVEGYQGGAVHLDTAGERIVLNGFDPSAANNAMTLAAWVNWEGNGNSITHQGIIGKRQGWDPRTNVKWFWEATPAGNLQMRNGDASVNAGGALLPFENEWIHVAMTWDDGAVVQYINGEEINSGTQTFRTTADATVVSIGAVSATNSETWVGSIDEARIYDTALTPVEIVQAMKGDTASASAPQPAGGATDVRRDVMLSWAAGEFAASHDVYMGISFDDVNEASRADDRGVLVSQGQTETRFDPGRKLAIDTTYYWRVDEVNAPATPATFKGEVWSFTIEPLSYPLAGVTATASSVFSDATGPENTVNGFGLNANGGHDSEVRNMWMTSATDPGPWWIEFAFDKTYALHEMQVWNQNQGIETLLGFGAKDVTIETSMDGEAWTTQEGITALNQASGQPDYQANNTVAFNSTLAQFVRITIHSNFGGAIPQTGLSEVQFSYIPVNAREPVPADGATSAGTDVTLAWRPGREAAQHEVVFSADEQAVADGSAVVATVDVPNHEVSGLDLGADYFWRINEVNDAGANPRYDGDLWQFTTPDSLMVDDMEAYADAEFLEIWAIWVDGFDDPANGSLVGNGAAGTPETGIVHGGSQSLPLHFGDGGAPVSEATRTFDQSQDWTRSGIQSLVLYLTPGVDNTLGGVYVKINDTKIVHEAAAGGLPPGWDAWTQWTIDLSAVADAASVRSLTIGVEGAGATGVIYVDSIQLFKNAPTAFQPLSWFEAEAADVMGASWRVVDDPTASGGSRIGSEDGDGDDNDTAPGAAWVASYTFTVPADGVYGLSLRAQEAGSDSFWVRIVGATSQSHEDPDQPGTGWVRFNEIDAAGGWVWDQVHSNDHGNAVVSWTLPAGTLTLEIAKREDGTYLDAIALMQ